LLFGERAKKSLAQIFGFLVGVSEKQNQKSNKSIKKREICAILPIQRLKMLKISTHIRSKNIAK